MTNIKLVVGQSAKADGAAFVEAWARAERDEVFEDRALTFQSWDALAAVMSAERMRLLRHVHAHPGTSVGGLAAQLRRRNRAVDDDIAALMEVGLLILKGDNLEATVDSIQAVVVLD